VFVCQKKQTSTVTHLIGNLAVKDCLSSLIFAKYFQKVICAMTHG